MIKNYGRIKDGDGDAVSLSRIAGIDYGYLQHHQKTKTCNHMEIDEKRAKRLIKMLTAFLGDIASEKARSK